MMEMGQLSEAAETIKLTMVESGHRSAGMVSLVVWIYLILADEKSAEEELLSDAVSNDLLVWGFLVHANVFS